MKKEKIIFNIDEMKNWKWENFQERIWFIKYWAKHILNNPLGVWSKGQADFINAQLRNSHKFYQVLDKAKREEMIYYLKEKLKS